MNVIDGRTWLEHLNPGRCWELLASVPVGRVGVINDSAPEIYPVNHAVDGQTIVFRTDPGRSWGKPQPVGVLRGRRHRPRGAPAGASW